MCYEINIKVKYNYGIFEGKILCNMKIKYMKSQLKKWIKIREVNYIHSQHELSKKSTQIKWIMKRWKVFENPKLKKVQVQMNKKKRSKLYAKSAKIDRKGTG